jgi:thyroxine 5-deiodinase
LAALQDLQQLYREFREIVSFVMIYIAEAHASDEWPTGKKLSGCKQHATLAERIAAAQHFQQETKSQFDMPMVVDSMDNVFANTFGAWPFRYFVLDPAGKLIFKAQPDPVTFMYPLMSELKKGPCGPFFGLART